jgi:uncharacterized heparinase superfamily protein
MILFKNLRLFFSTVRHLKYEQITGQMKVRLKKRFEKPDSASKNLNIPPFPGYMWNQKNGFLPPGSQNNSQSDMLDGWFEFLNCRHKIGWPPHWGKSQQPKLWRYNLYYFEYLWALDYDHAKFIAKDWIDQCTFRSVRECWEPYPVSLRIINFLGVFLGKYSKEILQDNDFIKCLWESIFVQTRWLDENIETHILGNHLFENAAAMTIAGSCFSGKEAECWFEKGFNLLKRELKEQILKDGVHFEQSPMYHCRITYLMCFLYNIGNQELIELIEYPLSKMIFALERFAHPDGGLALMGDSAQNVYNSIASLKAYYYLIVNKTVSNLKKENSGAFALPEAGYYGSSNDIGDYIICDMGSIGPDYLPAHGHADIFSFELTLSGHRIIVDSGVYDYEKSEMRNYCRSTKAHNTVEINSQDQCELWGIFRVGRRKKPFDVKWHSEKNGGFIVSGSHDGYKRLSGNPVHYREFRWDISQRLIVSDEVTASRHQTIVSRLHLHPVCTIDSMEYNIVWIKTPAGLLRISYTGDCIISIEKSFYCPEFGIKEQNVCIKAKYSSSKVNFGYVIEKI